MADRASLGAMRAYARESIKRSQDTLSELFGVEIPEIEIPRVYDEEHQHAFEIDRVAKQFATIVEAIAERVSAAKTDEPPPVERTDAPPTNASKSSGRRSQSK